MAQEFSSAPLGLFWLIKPRALCLKETLHLCNQEFFIGQMNQLDRGKGKEKLDVKILYLHGKYNIPRTILYVSIHVRNVNCTCIIFNMFYLLLLR